MSSSSAFEEYLLQATRLSRQRMIELYNAGYPWPLWTAHDTRRAGLLAYAKGVLFPTALAQVEAETDAGINLLVATFEADDRDYGSVGLTERMQVLSALPWFKELQTHVDEVVSRTAASPGTVFQMSFAIQRYALMHPGWESSLGLPHGRMAWN